MIVLKKRGNPFLKRETVGCDSSKEEKQLDVIVLKKRGNPFLKRETVGCDSSKERETIGCDSSKEEGESLLKKRNSWM